MKKPRLMLRGAVLKERPRAKSAAASSGTLSVRSAARCVRHRYAEHRLDKHGSINAVVESFFGVLKREPVNRTRYRTRDEARADIFDYIEVFYNRKRRHSYLGDISPVEYESRVL